VSRLDAVYLDLDGTLLGPGGSLLRDGEGAFSLLGARALEAVWRAGAELVLISGRRRSMLHEDARLLGAASYVFEAGAGYVLGDGRGGWDAPEWLAGASRREAIVASGAVDLVLEAFGPALWLDPEQEGREVTTLLRGEVDAAAADALLASHGHDGLRVLDNGPAKHLLPREVSKARGVDAHRRARGYAREACLGVGDSPEDLGAAEAVGSFWLVGNAEAPAPPGVRRAEASYGEGVYEAVMTTLSA